MRIDIGGRFVRKWELLASLRVQLNVGANAQSTSSRLGLPATGSTDAATGALAGFLRVRRRFPRGPIAPYVETVVGGGVLRSTLDVSSANASGGPLVIDSVELGYALVGAGAGIQIDLVSREKGSLALNMSTTFLGAFAGAETGLLVDWELGLLARIF